MTTATTSIERPIVNIAAYYFVTLDNLEERRTHLQARCRELEMKGTILLSEEGINMFLAASRASIDQFLDELRSDARLADVVVKESFSDEQPFRRMLVKIKDEIISFGMEGVDPRHTTSPKLSPQQLKQWLDEGRKIHLLDTRNDYEVDLGTFKGAIDPHIDHFREFPQVVRELPDEMKDEPIVMFCTGGIRCEKAGPFMVNEGFNQVYQLEGGILKYFEECGGAHYDGACFVFDQRVALDPALQSTGAVLCFACQMPVTVEQQESSEYVLGVSCPHCFQSPAQKRTALVESRNAAIREFVQPLPGSTPYENARPVNVPQRFAGRTLLDFLTEWHPHVSREEWQQTIENGLIVRRDGPATPSDIVREGERFDHLVPGTVEPDVNPDIVVMYEDDSIVVVNKPAPLPMHACGRFNRNTLDFILNEVYSAAYLRMAHRLDANTSGVVALCKTRTVARFVQPQFEARDVQKIYIARVQGHPESEQFTCSAPISAKPLADGLRLIDPDGQSAETEFRVIKRSHDGTALLEVKPLTGRTNQIRVHLWHLGLPVCGDPFYRTGQKTGSNRSLATTDPPLCLHARSIQFMHPESRERVKFEAPLPEWASDTSSDPP